MSQTVMRVLMVAALAIALPCAWLGSVESPVQKYSADAAAKRYVDDGLQRALLTYGTARALNAVLSVAQGIVVAVEPGGIGVNVSPGQILRPINNLVGQFADLMLMASIAFGAMEILIRIGGHWGVSLALSVVALTWAWAYWRGGRSPTWLARILFVLLVFRFAVPLISLGSEGIYSTFMANDYAANEQVIRASADQLEISPAQIGVTSKKTRIGRLFDWLWPSSPTVDDGAPDATRSVVAVLKDWLHKAGDPEERAKQLLHAVDAAADSIVRLMAVFLMQTVVIPLLLGWALLRGAAALLQIRPRPIG